MKRRDLSLGVPAPACSKKKGQFKKRERGFFALPVRGGGVGGSWKPAALSPPFVLK